MTPAQQTSRMVRFLSTGTPVLYPGDTAELCAARLQAAADEALRFSKYPRKAMA